MGKSKSFTVGYRYYMGLHMGVCLTADALLQIRVGDRVAWEGLVTTNQTIGISAPNLFGGESREGGVVGTLAVMFGRDDQVADDYLGAMHGSPNPAYRGFLGLVFYGPSAATYVPDLGPFTGMMTVYRSGYLSALNPYVKPWAFRVRSILEGWQDDTPWYPETASIGLMEGEITALRERFETGNLDLYSLFDGDSDAGFSVSGASGSYGILLSGPVASALEYGVIARDLPQALPLVRFRCLFTVLTIGNDDAMVELRGPTGALVFGFNPVREVTYDALRRPNVSIHGGFGSTENLMGAGPVEVDVPYQFDATYNADTGQFVATITDLRDDSVWDSIAIDVPDRDDVGKLAFRVEDVTSGGASTVLFQDLQVISGQTSGAMNPAHIIYQALTDPDWGMGYPTAVIDDASFTAAADLFFGESFGLCMKWSSQTSIREFCQLVADHAGLVFGQDRRTGLFRMLPLRDNYAIEDLPVFTAEDVRVLRYQRPSLADTVNEVLVTYTDTRTGKEATTAPLQNLANIQGQGRVVSQTLNFPGLPTHDLAVRVGMRELAARSTPLWRFSLEFKRKAYSLLPGEPFVLDLLDTHIGVRLVMRAGELDFGETADAIIRGECFEDVFALPASTYVADPGTGSELPDTDPQSATATAFELPYSEVARALPSSELSALPAAAGYLGVAAVQPSAVHGNFGIYTRTGADDFARIGTGDWTPSALLTAVAPKEHGPTVLQVDAGTLLGLLEVGTAAFLGEGDSAELVRVDAVDLDLGTVTVGRGCGDTVPDEWPIGTRLWGIGTEVGNDPRQYASTETVDAKVTPRTPSGELDPGLAAELATTMDSRAARPYPPGLFQLNGENYPAELTGDITITWAHRDRLLQADDLVDTSEASVGPEAGATYEVRGYLDDVLDHTESGVTGTSSLWPSPGDGVARVELWSVRDSLASWQTHAHEFTAGAGPLWTLANLATLPKVWLNDDSAVTDAGAGACSQWNDLSGNAYHFTQATSSARPLIVASGIGGRRVLRFDGTADYLLNNGAGARAMLSGVSAAYAAVVYDKVEDVPGAIRNIFGVSPTTGGGTLFALGCGSSAVGLENKPRIQARRLNGDTVATASADTARTDAVMVLGTVDYTGRVLRTYVNGALEEEVTGAWSAGGTCQSGTANRDVRVGADTNTTPGSFLNADLGELAVGTTALTTDEIDRIFGYMAHRWGLQALLPVGHPYKDDPPYA